MADFNRLPNILSALVTTLSDEVRVATETLTNYGASAPAAVLFIGSLPGNSIDLLSQGLQLSHSGTVRLVDKLVQEGLVNRERGQDGRQQLLSLTEKGASLRQNLLTERDVALHQALASLNTEEQMALEGLVARMLTGLPNLTGYRGLHICRLCNMEACHRDDCPIERGYERQNP